MKECLCGRVDEDTASTVSLHFVGFPDPRLKKNRGSPNLDRSHLFVLHQRQPLGGRILLELRNYNA